MKQETLYTRKGKTIRNIAENTSETFPSKNKAKKESVKLQRANGGLGMGSLIVLPENKSGEKKA